MTLPTPQAIWREQCEAALRMKERHGLNAASDYLVAEKLLNHAAAAAQNADFAHELPGFVAEVRRMFELQDIAQLSRTEGTAGSRGEAGRSGR